MIKVSVEVCDEPAQFRITVWANNIEQALRQVNVRYPGGEARVLFPIDPESYFVPESVGGSETPLVEIAPS